MKRLILLSLLMIGGCGSLYTGSASPSSALDEFKLQRESNWSTDWVIDLNSRLASTDWDTLDSWQRKELCRLKASIEFTPPCDWHFRAYHSVFTLYKTLRTKASC